MYYPIQIPYKLDKIYLQNMKYVETPAIDCGGFVICFWEMQPITDRKLSVKNIIAADACIDIVVSYDEKSVGFVGMSKTEFHFKMDLPTRSFGVRMMPGAFRQLTGLSAVMAMDSYLPFKAVFDDFNKSELFSLSFEEAKEYLRKFVSAKTCKLVPNTFTQLFNTLYENLPTTTKELYKMLNFSPRQCQRLFMECYGITPKMALSIIRFQKCLELLTSEKAKPADVLNAVGYYDQSHFINDFKRNIGITPLELIHIYQS